MANTDTNENTSIYEVGYLLAPTIPEDEVAEMEDELHQQITAADGDIVASQLPEMRELSYEIEVSDEGGKQKFARGQFGWVQFTLANDSVEEVESIFIQESDVIRHLLITVDPEDAGHRQEDAAAGSSDDDNDDEA